MVQGQQMQALKKSLLFLAFSLLWLHGVWCMEAQCKGKTKQKHKTTNLRYDNSALHALSCSQRETAQAASSEGIHQNCLTSLLGNCLTI
jgi:hypothetical protein